jgi:hypothetical protein
MLVGAGIFAEAYPFIKDNLLKWGDLGNLSIPKALGVNHWIIVALVWIMVILVVWVVEKRKL